MGMDFYRLEIKGVNLDKNLPTSFHVDDIDKMWNIGVLCLKNNERFKKWVEKSGFKTLKIRKMYSIDWVTFINSHSFNKKIFNIINYDDGANKEFNFIQIENNETGETSLFGNDDLPYKEEEYVFLDFKEKGYIRRPFTEDFSTQGYEALKEISPSEYEEANMYIYTLEEMEKLKSFTYDPKLFVSFYENLDKQTIFHVNW